MGILQDLEHLDVKAVGHDIAKSWASSPVGSAIDSAAKAAWEDLQSVAAQDLESAAATTATAILTGLAAGNPTGAIISVGIAEAEAAFANAGKQIASTTISTFVSAVHNQVATHPSVAAPPVENPPPPASAAETVSQ